ncbi:MAG TPA: hypothetical protein VGX23_14500 [Actinocrinis sp.]|nr:hypothetical protein [Actinocrinis sp.]
MSRKGATLILLNLHHATAGASRHEVVTDLLTVDDEDLLFWERERVVFRCSVRVVAEMTFAPATALYTAALREDLASANTRWSVRDDESLRELHAAGVSAAEIARQLGRRVGSIQTRVAKLGLRRPVASPQPPRLPPGDVES